MPVSYRFNVSEKLIEITCFGELVISEILNYFSDIKDDPTILPRAIELVDLAKVDHFNVDFKDASVMPSGYSPAHEVKEIRATILFGMNKLNEGLAHLIKAHFLHNLPDHLFILADNERDARQRAKRIHKDCDRGAC